MVREDIERMIIPSWVGRVPSDLGSARHGTLSQDALRTSVTIILVSSLTRIWGTKSLGSREQKLLANFLDLSTAISLALMRKLTPEMIDRFHKLWLKYLKDARCLYPHYGLVPNQHISLHLHQTMRNFGPASGQRTHFAERMNFLFQKIPTNSKPGKYMSIIHTQLLSLARRRNGVDNATEVLYIPEHPFTH